jgi:hypothetical protein
VRGGDRSCGLRDQPRRRRAQRRKRDAYPWQGLNRADDRRRGAATGPDRVGDAPATTGAEQPSVRERRQSVGMSGTDPRAFSGPGHAPEACPAGTSVGYPAGGLIPTRILDPCRGPENRAHRGGEAIPVSVGGSLRRTDAETRVRPSVSREVHRDRTPGQAAAATPRRPGLRAWRRRPAEVTRLRTSCSAIVPSGAKTGARRPIRSADRCTQRRARVRLKERAPQRVRHPSGPLGVVSGPTPTRAARRRRAGRRRACARLPSALSRGPQRSFRPHR